MIEKICLEKEKILDNYFFVLKNNICMNVWPMYAYVRMHIVHVVMHQSPISRCCVFVRTEGTTSTKTHPLQFIQPRRSDPIHSFHSVMQV